MSTVQTDSADALTLHLILCLGADFDGAYIPHLCKHYGRTVDSWNVLLHSNDLGAEGDRALASAARAFESSVISVGSNAPLALRAWRGEFDPFTKVDRLNRMVEELVPRGGWVLYVDADELLDAPDTAKALAAQSEAEQRKVVYGRMVDRFAPDKAPVSISADDDLFTKLPLHEEYTRTEMRAWTHKPCLVRFDGGALLSTCHDAASRSWADDRRSGRAMPTIWHFKWVESTREKLKRRVFSYQRQGIGWWPDIVKSLEDIYDEGDASREDRPSALPHSPHPYADLEARAFWKTAFGHARDNGRRHDHPHSAFWRPKWRLRPQDRVVTFGSCFARHLGPALRAHGFTWLETEPPPRGLSRESADRYGYGQFSCRTGSLATPTALRQWIAWALGDEQPPDESWAAGQRVVDPFRPTIEPDGFASRAEMHASRQQAIRSLRRAIQEADVLLFTLGMTESWVHDPDGWVYPACPGTVGGRFDPRRHRFTDLSFESAREALVQALGRLWVERPGLRILLTVSPIPLTATASGHHVLTATTRSKSTLRAVAGEVADSRPVVDYFPAYELVTTPMAEGMFAANRRSVSARGRARVMDVFFGAHGVGGTAPSSRDVLRSTPPASLDDDASCDDAWAEAFGE